MKTQKQKNIETVQKDREKIKALGGPVRCPTLNIRKQGTICVEQYKK